MIISCCQSTGCRVTSRSVRPNPDPLEEKPMKVQDIKEIAMKLEVPARKRTKAELVRAIQTKEGNEQCFDTGKALQCGQQDCLWREDCK